MGMGLIDCAIYVIYIFFDPDGDEQIFLIEELFFYILIDDHGSFLANPISTPPVIFDDLNL